MQGLRGRPAGLPDLQAFTLKTRETCRTSIHGIRRKLKIMPAVLALQERFNFTSHAESPPLFYIHFFILRADRIIVGEIRDSAAIDLLTAMNTGHDGSLSTGHANSPKDMLNRLETLFLMGLEIPLAAIRQQIASGIDIMIHLGRLRDKSRRVLEISEVGSVVDGKIELHPLFVFEEQGEMNGRVKGHLVRTKTVFSATGKAERAGVIL